MTIEYNNNYSSSNIVLVPSGVWFKTYLLLTKTPKTIAPIIPPTITIAIISFVDISPSGDTVPDVLVNNCGISSIVISGSSGSNNGGGITDVTPVSTISCVIGNSQPSESTIAPAEVVGHKSFPPSTPSLSLSKNAKASGQVPSGLG